MLEWLEPQWLRLDQTRLQGRLPHALLISGAEGVGKQQLAERLAFSLLCENPVANGDRCGRCPACGWLDAGSHPDLLMLGPDETGKAIKVDQIRDLCTGLGMTSHAGRYKIAIIQPADAMNVNAANSLLKTLEEPTDRTLLMLLTAAPGRLPATIRSRCQRIQVKTPEKTVAERWLLSHGVNAEMAARCLQLAHGAPLKALELALAGGNDLRDRRLAELAALGTGKLDPVQTARDWTENQERQSLEWWHAWLQNAIRWKLAAQHGVEPPVAQELRQILETVDCRQLFELMDKISGALRSTGSGLNRQLIMEDLLISWVDRTKRRQVAKHGRY
ncbi:MAG: DNA polymerase III subunit delta' [Thiogranum sp.]|nr:DNA polymerase III subunit delta' [Thiogranum sp.]